VRAIVTGGAGFIGSHVAEHLLGAGHEVLVVDNLSGGFRRNVPAGATFSQASILEPLREMFKAFKPDWVYHLAAYAAEGLSHHIPVFNYSNNLVGTANVLNAAYLAGAQHFVFTSSIAVYGHGNGTAFYERTPPAPCDPYGIAKFACEQHVQAFANYHGMRWTIFRPHNVFGPRQNIADPYRNVVGIFMRKCLRGEPMTIFGDGNQTRSFSYVNYVARSIAWAPRIKAARDEIFNIGGSNVFTVSELAADVARVLNRRESVTHLQERNEVRHACCDHNKAGRVFGVDPVSFQYGLERMAEWVQSSNASHAPTLCPSPIEVRAHLPPSWEGVQ
jgi:UDP-glucose 4-epimerase